MRIRKPVIIIGTPRSGTTLLFSILSAHPDLWSVYSESSFIEKYIGPDKLGWSKGNRVGPEAATVELRVKIVKAFYRRAINYQTFFPNAYSRVYANRLLERVVCKLLQMTYFAVFRPEAIRLVEKTPRNILRVPFMNAIFPDAHFVFLVRDPRANISSLIEGWRTPTRFETYDLPGGIDISNYRGSKWNFLLPPGWEAFSRGKTLAEVCAFQYQTANQTALEDLKEIADERKTFVKYESLVDDSEATVQRLCNALNLSYHGGIKNMTEQLPPVNTTSEPRREKWRKNECEIEQVLDTVRPISNQIGYIV